MPNQFLKSQSSLNPYWPREPSELDIKVRIAPSIGTSCPPLIECLHLPTPDSPDKAYAFLDWTHKFHPLPRPPRSGRKGMIVARHKVSWNPVNHRHLPVGVMRKAEFSTCNPQGWKSTTGHSKRFLAHGNNIGGLLHGSPAHYWRGVLGITCTSMPSCTIQAPNKIRNGGIGGVATGTCLLYKTLPSSKLLGTSTGRETSE